MEIYKKYLSEMNLSDTQKRQNNFKCETEM